MFLNSACKGSQFRSDRSCVLWAFCPRDVCEIRVLVFILLHRSRQCSFCCRVYIRIKLHLSTLKKHIPIFILLKQNCEAHLQTNTSNATPLHSQTQKTENGLIEKCTSEKKMLPTYSVSIQFGPSQNYYCTTLFADSTENLRQAKCQIYNIGTTMEGFHTNWFGGKDC